MAYLGLDVGSKRIGVAVSQSGLVARPLESFQRISDRQAIDVITALVDRYEVSTLVVGVPIRTDGTLSAPGEAIRRLSDGLKTIRPALTVETVDEALTSKEAERLGGSTADHDALAAALILEQYFAERSRAGSMDG